MNDRKRLADRWAGAECYLDGKLAIISGRLQDFATIGTLDGSQSVEFSWLAVDRIMRRRMEFKS